MVYTKMNTENETIWKVVLYRGTRNLESLRNLMSSLPYIVTVRISCCEALRHESGLSIALEKNTIWPSQIWSNDTDSNAAVRNSA